MQFELCLDPDALKIVDQRFWMLNTLCDGGARLKKALYFHEYFCRIVRRVFKNHFTSINVVRCHKDVKGS